MPLNVAKIYSMLGNPHSLLPIAVKDIPQTAGMTAGSYITGKEEGQDRLIDELGCNILWLFGIPAFKILFDLTIFRATKLDHNFDVRNLKDKNVLEKIKEYAQNEDVKKEIDKICNKEKMFKNTVIAKFALSTAATLITYIGLTKLKQNYTEKQIRKNLIDEYNKQKQANKDNTTIADTNINTEEKSTTTQKAVSAPSFKGASKGAMDLVEYFAFSPVRNMWCLDACITGERLRDARTKQELWGYTIKEASFLIFMYYMGDKIQELKEKQAKKKYNKSIDLDVRVLEDKWLKEAFENGSIQKSLDEFNAIEAAKDDSELSKESAKLYEFLHKNPDNLIVKAAKQSDIITTCKEPLKPTAFSKLLCKMGLKYKDTGIIDVRKYIDLKDIEGVYKKLSELYGQYKEAMGKETSDEFFNSVKKLKRGSVKTNIAASILALGILTPSIMLLKRFLSKDDAEFETKKSIREQLIKEGVIA